MAKKEKKTEIYKNFTGRNYTCAQTCSLRVWAKELRGGAWRIVKSNLMSVMGFQIFIAPGYYNCLVSPHGLFILHPH